MMDDSGKCVKADRTVTEICMSVFHGSLLILAVIDMYCRNL